MELKLNRSTGLATPDARGSEEKSPSHSPSWGEAPAQFNSTRFFKVSLAKEFTVRCTRSPSLHSFEASNHKYISHIIINKTQKFKFKTYKSQAIQKQLLPLPAKLAELSPPSQLEERDLIAERSVALLKKYCTLY